MTITRSTVVGNAANGFWADGASGPIAATISDSTFSNQAVGYAAIVAGDAAKLVVSRNVVVDNGSFGLVQYTTGIFESRGDNVVRNNNGGGVGSISRYTIDGTGLLVANGTTTLGTNSTGIAIDNRTIPVCANRQDHPNRA